MRNLINYYYQLEPIDIHQSNSYYTFTVKNEKYRLQEVSNLPIDQIYHFMMELWERGIYTHQIISTVSNAYFVNFDQKRYVLLKYYVDEKEEISFSILEEFQRQLLYLPSFSSSKSRKWGDLWSEKIDYFEYQMSQFGVKYPIIRESFAYYVGLAEVGISLFNAYFDAEEKTTLSHRRIKWNSTLYDLYDPFNLIEDSKVRDSAEYFKSLYMRKGNILKEIVSYLRNPQLSNYDRILFFIRMLFPSFYFDAYEEIMDNQKSDEPLKEIIEKSKNYDELLKEIYKELSNYMTVPYISWLKKM